MTLSCKSPIIGRMDRAVRLENLWFPEPLISPAKGPPASPQAKRNEKGSGDENGVVNVFVNAIKLPRPQASLPGLTVCVVLFSRNFSRHTAFLPTGAWLPGEGAGYKPTWNPFDIASFLCRQASRYENCNSTFRLFSWNKRRLISVVRFA